MATVVRLPGRRRITVDWQPARGPAKLRSQIPYLRDDLRMLLQLFAATVAALLTLWMYALLFTVSLFLGALLLRK